MAPFGSTKLFWSRACEFREASLQLVARSALVRQRGELRICGCAEASANTDAIKCGCEEASRNTHIDSGASQGEIIKPPLEQA